MNFDQSQVEIVAYPQRRILYVERRADAHGSFEEAAPAAIHALLEYINANEIPVDWSTIMGITPDDMRGDRANTRYWAGIVLADDATLPPSSEVHEGVLAGGRELTYTARGGYAGLPDWWMGLESYRAERNLPFRGPAYEVYIDNPSETPEAELRTVLHIPLQD